jgi:hypothetical protein
MTTSPSMLQKKTKGDGKNVVVTFFTATKQKEEGNDNILAIAFFAMLQEKKEAIVATLSSPFLLHYKKTKKGDNVPT